MKFKIGLSIVIGIFALIFLVNEFQIFGINFWGTRMENAKRGVYEKSQSYVQGKKQELVRYHHEWKQADEIGKKAIESTVRHSFSEFNEDASGNELSTEMYSFLKKCKYN